MEFYPDTNGFIGVLPNGDTETFSSQQEYEDRFWDEVFDMNNGFEIEMPEDYAA